MFLTRIELLGFKSFADKTVCALGEGITAVVGPNGCGKSNIVEAIRWVLGEQRPSMLRGKAMGDVIFSGSSSTGPVSMAQVSLVFDNTRGTLPFEAPEISVSRRLYKDGESKYLLNMHPCMLREIKDLFYNSGLGAPEYAIMQREMIDILLANRASERRVLIEEAAGIMRYRAHIKQSLSRLHNAESSIVRLTDIVGERERTVRRLKAEAGQARRVKTYRLRMLELRRMIAASAVRTLQSEAEPLRRALGQARQSMESHEARRAGVEARLESQRLRLAEQDQRIADTLSEQSRVREELSSATAAVALLDAREEDMAKERDRLRREIEETLQRKDAVTGLLTEAEGILAVRNREIASAREAAEGHDAQRVGHESNLRAIRQEVSAAQAALGEVERGLQSAIHESEKRELEVRHAKERMAALITEAAVVAQQCEGETQRAAELSRQLDAVEDQLLQSDQAISRVTLQCDKVNRVLRRAEEAAQACALAQRDVAARREVMWSTFEAHEGFSEGARFLMARQPDGLLCLLGEEVTPHPGYERAVEAALAESVDFVVVAHRDAARHLLELLRTAHASRAKVVEFALAGKPNGPPPQAVPHDNGIVGPLLDVVDAPETLLPVVRSLLGRTLLLRTLPADHQVQELWDHGWAQLVTMEGDVLRADGIHQGGTGSHATLLGRRSGLDRIDALLSKRSQQEQLRSVRVVKLRERRAVLTSELEGVVAQRQGITVERARIAAALGSVEDAVRRATAAAEGMAAERTRMEDAIQTCDEARLRAESEVNDWRARQATAAEAWAEADQKLRSAEEELEVAEEARAPLRQRIALVEQEVATARGNVDRLRLQLETEERLIPRLRERESALLDAMRHTEVDRTDRNQRVESARRQLDDLDAGLTSAREVRSRLAERVNTLERTAAEVRDRARREREEVHGAEIELAKREARLQEVVTHATQDLEVTPAELAETEAAKPLADLEAELNRVSARCAAMGDVNVRADEQFAVESVELEKLQRELRDVRESRDQLLKSIDQANRTARERFTVAFERVSTHFKETFATLVPGGQARLDLPGEGSILTRDIEIVVQPPGKRSRPVELLSGGERALTALAFLFGVYREKAGPLCVLDEVDAPLDDPNTSRFMEMLETLSTGTQFIVVTHNKHTMARAARLLGVTMESGVSRLVPVELRKVGGQ